MKKRRRSFHYQLTNPSTKEELKDVIKQFHKHREEYRVKRVGKGKYAVFTRGDLLSKVGTPKL